MNLSYPAIFRPLVDSCGYCVIFPDLHGCVTQGNSFEEAMEMAIDAASGWIITTIESGDKLPVPTSQSAAVEKRVGDAVYHIPIEITVKGAR